jgi:two-component system, OmpR family, sensor histidine kinase VicK
MPETINFSFDAPSSNISFIYDINSGRFTYADKILSGLFQLETGELSSERLLSAIHQDDHDYLKKRVISLIDGTFKGSINIRLMLTEGEKWVRVTPFLLKQSGNIIAGNVSDITSEIHNLQSIEKYANKKNSVLNVLAHDLRGPLGVVNMVAQIIEREMVDKSLIGRTQTISKMIKQCIDLITDLTDREFLETMEIELVKKRVNVALKVGEYIEEYRRSEDPARRSFKFSCSDESIYINLDEPKFMQILNNLMTNSLKFTREGGTISINVEDQKDSVLFTFSDDGIGIPKEYQSDIFNKFTDARRKGLHGEPSVGLGLSIVKTIVDWHKGKIWFESKENEGTTFYIEIPKTS